MRLLSITRHVVCCVSKKRYRSTYNDYGNSSGVMGYFCDFICYCHCFCYCCCFEAVRWLLFIPWHKNNNNNNNNNKKYFFFFNKSLSAPDVEAEVKFPGHLLR